MNRLVGDAKVVRYFEIRVRELSLEADGILPVVHSTRILPATSSDDRAWDVLVTIMRRVLYYFGFIVDILNEIAEASEESNIELHLSGFIPARIDFF